MLHVDQTCFHKLFHLQNKGNSQVGQNQDETPSQPEIDI